MGSVRREAGGFCHWLQDIKKPLHYQQPSSPLGGLPACQDSALSAPLPPGPGQGDKTLSSLISLPSQGLYRAQTLPHLSSCSPQGKAEPPAPRPCAHPSRLASLGKPRNAGRGEGKERAGVKAAKGITPFLARNAVFTSHTSAFPPTHPKRQHCRTGQALSCPDCICSLPFGELFALWLSPANTFKCTPKPLTGCLLQCFLQMPCRGYPEFC